MRTGRLAAVLAAVAAAVVVPVAAARARGERDSRKGRLTAAPRPRRMVRREGGGLRWWFCWLIRRLLLACREYTPLAGGRGGGMAGRSHVGVGGMTMPRLYK